MPRLELKNATEGRISLDEFLDAGQGLQVLSGVTGLGLPPLDTQWLEGAGDGARFRGRRVRTRVIDLPLLIEGPDREGLKAETSRLARILAGELEVHFIDGTEDWFVTAHRTSGGGYVYGSDDTTGERDLLTIVTLEAGDPYWSRLSLETVVTPLVSSTDVTLDNPGDADAKPFWRFRGPLTSVNVASPDGKQSFFWSGALAAGATLTVDAAKGTIRDGAGLNRYHELGRAPRFWSVPAGSSSSHIQTTGAGTGSYVTVSWRPRKWQVI